MAINTQTYSMENMVEQDRDTAPSLDLKDFVVEKFFLPKDKSKYMVFLANVRNAAAPTLCPFCKGQNTIVKSGRADPRLVHDVIRNNHRVDIVFQPQRYQCRNCNQRFVPPMPEIDESHAMTTRLMDYLRKECFLQPHTELAERSGVSIETIRNITNEEIDKFEAEREQNRQCAPRVLGIDEKHLNKQMRGILVDSREGLLVDMLEDNREQTMKDAIQKLMYWDTNIKVVTTDMNNNYLKWLPQFLPNATIVIDKFHVIQDIQLKIKTTKKELYNNRKKMIDKIEDLLISTIFEISE